MYVCIPLRFNRYPMISKKRGVDDGTTPAKRKPRPSRKVSKLTADGIAQGETKNLALLPLSRKVSTESQHYDLMEGPIVR